MWKKIKWKNAVAKACCLVLSVLFIIQGSGVSVLASDYWPEGTEVVSPNAIVMELSTGTILYEKNSL